MKVSYLRIDGAYRRKGIARHSGLKKMYIWGESYE